MRLPTAIEINPFPECLDGKCAVEHFEGKTLEEAQKLFEENGLFYSEDLMWMGPIGFMFYFKAALNYLQSKASHDDSDFLNGMIGTLESRITSEYNDYDAIKGGTDDYVQFCKYALDHYDCYELDPDIYGDLKPQIEALLKHLHS